MNRREIRRYAIAILAGVNVAILSGWQGINQYIPRDHSLFTLYIMAYNFYILYIFAKGKFL